MVTNVRLPKIHEIPPEVDFQNLLGLLQNLSLEKKTQPTLLSRDTHITILLSVVIRVMNVWNQASWYSATCSCLPIWWLIEQVCSLIIECQAYQFVPSTSISRQFVSTPWKILQLIHVPLSWNDDHPSDDSRLCIVAVFLPDRNIFQRIFWTCPSILVGPRNRLCVRLFPPW